MITRIKVLKNEQKLTNQLLSEKSGVPVGTLAKILAASETKDPQISNVIKIAKALNVSCSYLIHGEEEVASALVDAKEKSLIDNYKLLNEEGQEKVIDYVDDLVQSEKYKKSNQSGLEKNA